MLPLATECSMGLSVCLSGPPLGRGNFGGCLRVCKQQTLAAAWGCRLYSMDSRSWWKRVFGMYSPPMRVTSVGVMLPFIKIFWPLVVTSTCHCWWLWCGAGDCWCWEKIVRSTAWTAGDQRVGTESCTGQTCGNWRPGKSSQLMFIMTYMLIIIPAKASLRGDYVITGVRLSVRLSVCLSVTTITK